MVSEATLQILKDKADRLRVHSLRSTSEAGSGHPTSCLSAAEIVAALFFYVMRYDPHDPNNPHNDRFILSKGHAAPILYAALAEMGVIAEEKLLTLRRVDSELEGHPTPRLRWVQAATGSLGQGLSIGAGMALNGKYLDKDDYRVYVLLGDGECAEGSVYEAAAFAAYYKLDNLIAIIDVNALGQSQETMYGSHLEPYLSRFEALGWHSIGIDGHNLEQILAAFSEAEKVKGKPVCIAARTIKGKGVSFLEGKDGWHGKPLKKGEELERALSEIKLDGFDHKASIQVRLPPRPQRLVRKDPPPPATTDELAAPPAVGYKLGDKVATREAYGNALVKLGDSNPLVVALDGDTKNSTYSERFMRAHPERFFECFVAEQNMVGAALGLATCGKIPFVSTFAAFFTRAFDHIRMAAISRANIKFAGSHAGVSIGEDGPSQMGLEDLAMMRAIPESIVLYPADAVCMEKLVFAAAEHQGIVYLRMTRPKTPIIYQAHEEFHIGGSKLLRASRKDVATIVAAGITVIEALKAYEELAQEGLFVRVIDAYSIKPIDASTLLKSAAETDNTLITVEDHYYDGGLGDAVLSALAAYGVRVHKLAVRQIPRSGKPEELLDLYGISARAIAAKVRGLLKR